MVLLQELRDSFIVRILGLIGSLQLHLQQLCLPRQVLTLLLKLVNLHVSFFELVFQPINNLSIIGLHLVYFSIRFT